MMHRIACSKWLGRGEAGPSLTGAGFAAIETAAAAAAAAGELGFGTHLVGETHDAQSSEFTPAGLGAERGGGHPLRHHRERSVVRPPRRAGLHRTRRDPGAGGAYGAKIANQ